MASTFDDIWRELVFYNPEVPKRLIQSWVKDGFQEVRDTKLWSWAVKESQFTVIDAVSDGTITVTKDSVTITGAGTTFLAAHVGEQIKIGNHVFTVATRTSDTEITIDRVFPDGTEAGVGYTIFTAYITAPSDFYGFVSVLDPNRPARLITDMDQSRLDWLDPQRQRTGEALALADLRYSPDTTPLPMYELWPHQKSAKGFRILYWSISSDFSALQELPYTIPDRLIKLYALSELADWPGTRDKPNPMHNFRQADRSRVRFEALLQKLAIEDGEIYATEVWTDVPSVLITSESVRSGPFSAHGHHGHF